VVCSNASKETYQPNGSSCLALCYSRRRKKSARISRTCMPADAMVRSAHCSPALAAALGAAVVASTLCAVRVGGDAGGNSDLEARVAAAQKLVSGCCHDLAAHQHVCAEHVRSSACSSWCCSTHNTRGLIASCNFHTHSPTHPPTHPLTTHPNQPTATHSPPIPTNPHLPTNTNQTTTAHPPTQPHPTHTRTHAHTHTRTHSSVSPGCQRRLVRCSRRA
jgi:hypothetical protein